MIILEPGKSWQLCVSNRSWKSVSFLNSKYCIYLLFLLCGNLPLPASATEHSIRSSCGFQLRASGSCFPRTLQKHLRYVSTFCILAQWTCYKFPVPGSLSPTPIITFLFRQTRKTENFCGMKELVPVVSAVPQVFLWVDSFRMRLEMPLEGSDSTLPIKQKPTPCILNWSLGSHMMLIFS